MKKGGAVCPHQSPTDFDPPEDIFAERKTQTVLLEAPPPAR
jgi:hypothetical protein